MSWLHSMPTRWGRSSPKALFGERRTPNSPDDVHLTPSQRFGVLPQSEYLERTGGFVVQNLAGQDKMKHVEMNDFIIHLRSFQGGLERAHQSGKVSSAYTVIEPKPLADPGYYGWTLKSSAFIQELQTTTNQLRDGQSIRWSDFIKVPLPTPPLDEQQEIADYLDRETKRIDELIAEQRGLIEILRERRRSVLERTFARDDSSKRSVKLRRVLRKVKRPASTGDGVITAYRDGIVTLRSNRRSEGYTESISENGYQRILPGDLVFHGLDGFAGAVGVSDSCGNATPVYHVCEAQNDDNLEYLAALLRYMGQTGLLAVLAPNVRQRAVDFRNWGTFSDLDVFLVPRDEQDEAITKLKREYIRIDALIAESEGLIALSLERRAALITAAVTGQMDVRTAA